MDKVKEFLLNSEENRHTRRLNRCSVLFYSNRAFRMDALFIHTENIVGARSAQ